MAKTEKPAATAEAEAAAPQKKSKKMLFIIIALVIVLIIGGVAAFLLLGHDESAKPEDKAAAAEHTQETAVYVELGTFTANLIREDGDRYLQTAISLKLSKSGLEEKVKTSRPEIMHRINMLLQSKSQSALASTEGRELLAQEIKEQIEYVMGFRKVAPVIGNAAESVQGESAPAKTETPKVKSDLTEVLFTSFIIQ